MLWWREKLEIKLNSVQLGWNLTELGKKYIQRSYVVVYICCGAICAQSANKIIAERFEWLVSCAHAQSAAAVRSAHAQTQCQASSWRHLKTSSNKAASRAGQRRTQVGKGEKLLSSESECCEVLSLGYNKHKIGLSSCFYTENIEFCQLRGLLGDLTTFQGFLTPITTC